MTAGRGAATLAGIVIACLHNLEDAFTGHAGPALRSAGAELDERHLRDGDPLPAVGEVDGVVSFGGEQTVTAIDREPTLAREAALLREAVEHEVPVLGVCLGAQLLAHALGGEVRRLDLRMIQWTPLVALPAAAGDPVVGSLPQGAMALHWNEDGFSLPPGAVELLESPAGTVEAFRAGPCAWGVQFHPEVDDAGLDSWYRDWGTAPTAAGVTEQDARRADVVHLPGQRALAEAIFGGFAAVVAARRRAAA